MEKLSHSILHVTFYTKLNSDHFFFSFAIVTKNIKKCFKYWILICYFKICVSDSEQLVITNISVPELVRLGDVDYVILDCEYDLENDSSNGLVVKWFFNKYVLLYQWIYHSPPQADPSFQKYIDLNYMATEDNYTMYRAMKLNKPDVELSGEYTCSVSTYADEDDKTASMTVYCKYQKVLLQNFLAFCFVTKTVCWFEWCYTIYFW